jgi:putative redox protein
MSMIPEQYAKVYELQGTTTITTTVTSTASSSMQPSSDDSKRSVAVGTRVKFPGTGCTLRTDLPIAMGGTDTAPQPIEYLLTALVGCTQATAVFVGRHMHPRVTVERLDFALTGIRDERGALTLPITAATTSADPGNIPSRLQLVQGTITVHATTAAAAPSSTRPRLPTSILSQQQLDLLKHQTELRCPVANMMIASGCRMEVEWRVPDISDHESDSGSASSRASG